MVSLKGPRRPLTVWRPEVPEEVLDTLSELVVLKANTCTL